MTLYFRHRRLRTGHMMDSGNEMECPPTGESPYLHASLGHNYVQLLVY